MDITCTEMRDFARAQEGEFSYLDVNNCACAQFLKTRGVQAPCVGGTRWHDHASTAHGRIEESLGLTLSSLSTDHHNAPVKWSELADALA